MNKRTGWSRAGGSNSCHLGPTKGVSLVLGEQLDLWTCYLPKYTFGLSQLLLFVIKSWTKGPSIRRFSQSISVCSSRRWVCGFGDTAKLLRCIGGKRCDSIEFGRADPPGFVTVWVCKSPCEYVTHSAGSSAPSPKLVVNLPRVLVLQGAAHQVWMHVAFKPSTGVCHRERCRNLYNEKSKHKNKPQQSNNELKSGENLVSRSKPLSFFGKVKYLP